MNIYVWVLIGYSAGTLPSPYLIALVARRKDLIDAMRRPESQGDAHFLVTKRLSKTAGVTAIVLDMVKGFVPALVAHFTHAHATTIVLVGVACVIGHCFPPYFRRSGGRGLTTAAGVALALVPKAMGGSGVIALAGTIGKRGGLGTSIGFGLLPIFALLFGYDSRMVTMCAAIVAVIAVRRLEGMFQDRRSGVGYGRILVSRLLFDLPRGEFH
ncbi:MAG: glycerol-3-phosphate acyltransferase [Actinomycetota bacterium]